MPGSGGITFIFYAAWAGLGLLVALFAAGFGGRWKGFIGTLVVMWGVIPGGCVVYENVRIGARSDDYAKAVKKHAELCAPDREIVRRTVQNIAEVAIWPEKGPAGFWGKERSFTPRFIGPEAGRHGGYRDAKMVEPDAPVEAGPRHRVVFEELAGLPGKPWLRGVRVKIIDAATAEVMGERTDYAVSNTSAGCSAGDGDQWFEETLAFIHRVVTPPPGVADLDNKNLPVIHEREVVRPDAIPDAVHARLVKKEPHVLSKLPPIQEAVPAHVRYRHHMEKRDGSLRLADYALVLMQPHRDIVIRQGLGTNSPLLAMSRHNNEYVALFAAGVNYRETPPYLILRRFNEDGDLLRQERVLLPDSVILGAHLKSARQQVDIIRGEYRVYVWVERGSNGDEDLELAIPRSTVR